MNVRKRGLALLMCICMIFTLLPFSAFADASADKSVVYGKYDNGTWTQDDEAGDTVTYSTGSAGSGNSLALTKTATKTGDNTYQIDLMVVSTQTTTTTPPGAAATVLVIDTSGSMNICATCNNDETKQFGTFPYYYDAYVHKDECKTGQSGKVEYEYTRLASAKNAAISFLNTYKGTIENTSRYVSVVSLNTTASVTQDWLDVSVSANYNTVKSSINNLSANGGTNLDQALSNAKAQISADTVKDIPVSAKNVIALTDGCPTYYGNGTEQHGSYGCPDTNTATTKSATELKKSSNVYTVCFGASEDKCWKKNSGHKWVGLVVTKRHQDDGPKVGDFLRKSIATSETGKTYAYDAKNTTELMKAFKAITSSITEGIKTGTVLDPMGDHITVTSRPDNFVETANGYTWELGEPKSKVTENGKTTYTYELTYTVTFNPDFVGFDENGYYAANKETTFTAGGEVYNFNVPGVKGTAPRYTVTYRYANAAPEGATDVTTLGGSYKKDDTVTVAGNPSVDGWTFSGWSVADDSPTKPTITDNGQFNMPNGNVVLEGSWTKRTDLSYKVHHYLNGTTERAYPDETVSGQTFNTTVMVNPKEANADYTPVSTEAKPVTITTGNNEIIFYYYKNVTLTANSKTVTYNGEEQIVSGFTGAPEGADFSSITVGAQGTNAGTYPAEFASNTVGTVDKTEKYIVVKTDNGKLEIARANVTVKAKDYEIAVGSALPTPEADVSGLFGTDTVVYTINGMPENSNTAGTHTLTPSGEAIQGNYNVTYETGTLTIYDTYTVTYKYECTDGSSVPETVTAPVDSNSPYRAGSSVTVLNAPTDTIDGYIFDGWYIGTTKMDGKSFEIMSDTVITGKWKPVTGLTCTINYIWNGNKTKPIESVTIDGLTYNETITKSPIDIPGFTPVSKESKNCVVKKDGNVINFYYYMNVKLVAEDDSTIYNGKDYTANVNYDVVTKVNNKDFKLSGVEFKGVKATVTEQNAGSYSIPFNIDPVKDKTVDTNEYYLVTEVVAGTLTIAKRTVTIIGCDSNPKTITYDGKEHTFNDFSVAPTTDDTGLVNGHIVIAKDGKVIYTLTGKDPNTYDGLFDKDNVDIVAQVGNEFASVFNNYNVEYQIGHMTIKKASTPVNPGIYTEIIVEITGSSDSVVYDGTEHSVKGYTVKISDPRYTEADFTFTGKAEASGVNAGTYEMGLKAEQFRNTNALFRNVKFVIKADGVLTITPKDLTITAGSKTEYGPTPVTCGEWTVSGLVAGDKVESVKITGIQSVPGSSPNVPSDAVIKNAKGEDVTKNYAIKYVNGTLTMLEVLNKEDHFNYIIGTPEGLSLPTANVTRAEVATIFFRLMTDDARAKFDSLDNNFSDVAKGKWYNRAISTLAKAGIIKGDPAGTYRPGDPITRAEMAAIIARFGDFKEGGKTFSDISGHWAQKYIELAASNGWINGNPDGTFKPNNNITRAETVAMINRVLDRQTKDVSDLLPVAQMTNWSDNMDTAKWYYRDMQEATNNHKAERVGDSIYEKWTEKLPDIDWASYQI